MKTFPTTLNHIGNIAPNFLNTALCLSHIIFAFSFYPHFTAPLNFKISDFKDGFNGKVYGGGAHQNIDFIDPNTISSEFRTGRARYVDPLHLWDSSTGILTDFTTHFSFTIDTLNKSQYSDDFAFYMSPVGYPFPPDSEGGYLGLFNINTCARVAQNHFVLVEFDIRPNAEPEIGDPPVEHVGMNSNSLAPLAYAEEDFGMHNGKLGNACIAYNAATKNLSVMWTFQGNPVRSLSCKIDLKSILPEKVSIGFSAGIGWYPERLIIHSWEFNSTLNSTEVARSRKNNICVIFGLTSLILVLLVVGICWLILIIKLRRKKYHISGNTTVSFDLQQLTSTRRFCYSELVVATNGFAKDRKLGRGGSGQVYKGIMSDSGQAVAVKRIFVDFEDSERIFVNEVRVISCLKHRNVVRFIGWCEENGEFFLVYECMSNGSLDTHLFNQTAILPWHVRYKIALGMATALHYLHEEVDKCVLHRDIKPANVLLDTDFNTKLGDFGLAKLVDPIITQKTGLGGTLGYLAPECLKTGRATKESDVYSFGVVILEIACGRRTYMKDDGEYHMPLCSWVWQLYLEDNILSAADEQLKTDFDENEMECLLTVGLWCTHLNDKARPTAGQIIRVLQREAPLPSLANHDMHRITQHADSFPLLPFTWSYAEVGR